MKKKLTLLMCSLGSLLASEDDWSLNNTFTMYGDVVVFERTFLGTNKHLVSLASGEGGYCTTKELIHHFDFETGFKAGAKYMTHHTVWDFCYLWLPEWSSHCSGSAPQKILFPLQNPASTMNLLLADEARTQYKSQFQTCELNFFRYATLRHGNYFSAAWMLGLRYMTLKERLHISSSNQSMVSYYRNVTANHIPAFQVGGLMAWNPTRRLSWELLGKIGLGFDQGWQKTFLNESGFETSLVDRKKRGFSAPFLTEGSLTLSYQALAYLNFQASYHFIYLNGVAIAISQRSKKHPQEIRYTAGGEVLLQGFTAGIGVSF